MRRSVAFYRDTHGLGLKFESPAWSEFETGATTLALHAGTRAASGEAATQVGRAAGTCSLGFSELEMVSLLGVLPKSQSHTCLEQVPEGKKGTGTNCARKRARKGKMD
jgi:hypothetical protein